MTRSYFYTILIQIGLSQIEQSKTRASSGDNIIKLPTGKEHVTQLVN